jgi:hypothetical protein
LLGVTPGGEVRQEEFSGQFLHVAAIAKEPEYFMFL